MNESGASGIPTNLESEEPREGSRQTTPTGDDALSKASPMVCAVMLTRDRPEMAARAVRCFQAQTYERKRLLIVCNSEYQYMPVDSTYYFCTSFQSDLSFGGLRNLGARQAVFACHADIICHWDDDDISHPNRIAEQVAFLQASGAGAVGYRDMLFWKTETYHAQVAKVGELRPRYIPCEMGEAWLYTNQHPQFFLDTSACYWRSTWEKQPFPSKGANSGAGADMVWWTHLKSKASVSSLPDAPAVRVSAGLPPAKSFLRTFAGELLPRMIASIHGGNMSSKIMPNAPEWRRVPEWDSYCAERMAL